MLTKIMAKFGWTKQPKPAFSPDDIAKSIAAAMSAAIPGARVHVIDGRNPHKQTSATDVPPPPNPDMPPSLTGWQNYVESMKAATVTGWAFGRMGIEGIEDSVTFFFGNLRGDYGVFTVETGVCYEQEPPEDHEEAETHILAQLVHLPSGAGLGVFETRQLACKAGELLEASGFFTLHEHMPREKWLERREDVHRLWRFHGMVEADFYHAHPLGNPHAIPIYRAAPIEADKPKVLS